ncbi:MAG: hypothetical protein AB1410_09185 [Acidobacteriota bacterium]
MAEIVRTKNYDEELYTKVEMQELILFGIYLVSKNGEICTFERLVAESFTRFPKVFAFKRFSKWPDSLKFDRPLRTLREKGLIVGGAKDYFSLTKFGEKLAIQIKERLEGERVLNQRKKASKGRSVDDRLVSYLKDSLQFKTFLKDHKNFSISEKE